MPRRLDIAVVAFSLAIALGSGLAVAKDGGGGGGDGGSGGGSGSGNSGSGSSGSGNSGSGGGANGRGGSFSGAERAERSATREGQRGAVQRGESKSTAEAIGRAVRSVPGDVVGAGRSGNGPDFQVKIIDRSGRLMRVQVNGWTGEIKGVEGK